VSNASPQNIKLWRHTVCLIQVLKIKVWRHTVCLTQILETYVGELRAPVAISFVACSWGLLEIFSWKSNVLPQVSRKCSRPSSCMSQYCNKLGHDHFLPCTLNSLLTNYFTLLLFNNENWKSQWMDQDYARIFTMPSKQMLWRYRISLWFLVMFLVIITDLCLRNSFSLCIHISQPFDAYRPIYGSYRTDNIQTLHFIYLFNKYRYWIF